MSMLDTLTQLDFSMLIDNLIHFRVSSEVMSMCAALSVVGAIILAKFTGSIGTITFPVHFCTLLIGTILTNGILNGIDIPAFQYQQEAFVYSIGGMISTSFAMLWFTGVDA
jgi:hypothetical protein